ncbi:MAG TPA: dephospho-CoA kinase [Vicinamibacterales bacterium]|jgi:dephospho-CoA kinase|nr:dephospho-CoA kinase [Vicinamibacterales bacterium]
MVLAALTGGIATGKSYCIQRFASLGAEVIDADRLAREAVEPGTRGLAAVASRFGTDMVRADGSLDRQALGRLVFTDARARADLEAIVHPEVYRRIREWSVNLPVSTRLAVADIPLLFETGHEHDFDTVIVCACSPEEQVRRVVARDGLTEREARARVSAQWPIEEKVDRANHVIRTDGSFGDTDRQVSAVYQRLTGLKSI